MTQQTPYIGSKISLISKLDIRYEGILYTVDSKESTIALSKVRSFGTEDRNAAHVVPPQDEVYDYIIFKANDIKDLIVCETPKPPAPGLPYDPAILSVSQGNSGSAGEKPTTAPAPVGSERSGSANATRSSTPRNANTRSPSQQQQGQTWKNNDNRPNNSNYRQGNYQNRNNQNRQHGYEGNNKQPSRNYESQNRNGYQNNYRQGQQNNRNYESQNRNNAYNSQNRNGGGSRNNPNNRGNNGNGGNNRSHGGPRNNLKFENDYDFEKAYEQFKETLEAIVGDVQNIKIDDSHDNDASSVKSGEDNESFYDKNKSFFDSISCEALEKEEGKNTRPDWRKERLTNQETFGQQSVRSFGYRRGGYNNRGGNGGYNNHRGGGGYNNRGGQYNNRRSGYNNRGGDYSNKREGGGGY